jgi:hemolysin-activating ACP:hemolysin acyltransferase
VVWFKSIAATKAVSLIFLTMNSSATRRIAMASTILFSKLIPSAAARQSFASFRIWVITDVAPFGDVPDVANK